MTVDIRTNFLSFQDFKCRQWGSLVPGAFLQGLLVQDMTGLPSSAIGHQALSNMERKVKV
ncbi:hypothetical protein DPMN_164382 [Dreissena polymorpha]|uniref:Uncharacterized protein n=1 Tax=Dreissena polymorpha TaxID=45954 RepID=A0A9D4ISA9_DREPO|nr:hypothetical protein DPMN_164382 [Dreissena polymorpha]